MNYLVTGGTGLIGKAVVAKLVQTNAQVTVLTRDLAKAKATLPSDVLLIDEVSITEIEQSDVVINLAGEAIADKRWSVDQKTKICDSRWTITDKLASLINAAKTPPKLFISGSAIGIYGRQNENAITEGFTEFHPEFTHDKCYEWENIAMQASSKKTRVALLRTGIVLDKHKGALSKMLLPFKLGLGGPIGKGEQFMSWIHIEDMVNAIIHIIEHDELFGPINMTAELAVTNKAFSSVLASTLKRPCIFTTPTPVLKLIFGEMADLLIFGQNVYPEKLIATQFSFKHPVIEEALQNLLNSSN